MIDEGEASQPEVQPGKRDRKLLFVFLGFIGGLFLLVALNMK